MVAIKVMSKHSIVLAQNAMLMKEPNVPEEKRDANRKSISISEGTKHGENEMEPCVYRDTVRIKGGVTMARADEIFIDMCRDILDNGTST